VAVGARAGLEVLDADPDQAVAHFDRIGARRFVAHETGPGCEIERPRVVRARQVRTQDLSLDERVAFVRARVGDGVDASVDAEDGDLVPVMLDERSPVGLELLDGNRQPVRHS
jgi:hypothetical protein